MHPQWAVLARDYLARRDKASLDAAIAAASDPEISDLLRAVADGDLQFVLERADALAGKLDVSGRYEEALTVGILGADPMAFLVESFSAFPREMQDGALQAGVANCRQAGEIAGALGDLPLVALYKAQLARGLQEVRDMEGARRAYEEALVVLRPLAQERPAVHEPDVATTLKNLGNVLLELRELGAARPAYDEALAVLRRLARERPSVYEPDVAQTLVMLATVLNGLRDLEGARRALEEALAVLRRLAQEQPAVYEPAVAGTLNNLGIVLRDLREMEGARRECEEALAVWRRLARERPAVYEPDVAIALNNLGNVLRDLRELEKARRAFEEALAVRRWLALERPAVYEPDFATTLNNLGVVLRDLRELEGARRAYEEALAVLRRLAQEQPAVYEPAVASTLNNLGILLRDLRELEGARRAYEEALAVLRRLAQERPAVYEPAVAHTLNNLGNVLRDLRELQGARQAFEDALMVLRRLAQEQPAVYEPDVATTLNNLGNVLWDLRELEGARRAYEDALGVLRRLARPAVYEPDIATTLSNLGNVLRELRELEGAWRACEEALAVRRRLAQERPAVYESDVAATLNSLGNVLGDLRELEGARRAYEEAIHLGARHCLWLTNADTHTNLSLLEEEQGDPEASLRECEAAVESCERGLGQLAEQEHRDVFKGRLESMYVRLIAHEAEQAGNGTDRTRLIRLLESLRQVETLAGFGTAAEPARWDHMYRELAGGHGPLCDRFRNERAAFLWMHATGRGTVFVTLSAGECRVEMAPPGTHDKLAELFQDVEIRLSMFADRNPALAEAVSLSRQAAALGLDKMGGQAFDALPEGVRSLLGGDRFQTVFVAPCAASMNLPLEMLVADGEYVGLRKLLVRVPSLAGLGGILECRPEGRAAVVVGNPLHSGAKPLAGASVVAGALSQLLRARHYSCNPLMENDATGDAVMDALSAPGPVLWAHMGHGGRPEQRDGAEYLALAGTDKLLPGRIAQLRWRSHPLVHHDCCVAGHTRGRGGGRFDGHPVAALLAGASAVLASVHPLWDDTAAEFSAHLYDKLLDRPRPHPLGQALMATRRETAKTHTGNPLVWATTIPWGNPWISLPV